MHYTDIYVQRFWSDLSVDKILALKCLDKEVGILSKYASQGRRNREARQDLGIAIISQPSKYLASTSNCLLSIC